MNYRCKFSALALAIAAILPNIGHANDDDNDFESNHPHELVYTLSNATANQVLAFQRFGNGQLRPAGQFATGGNGTGAGLGNQGALALSANARYLFAVNPGSSDISVFKVTHRGLALLDRVAEDGLTPVSIAVSRHRVYVVNAGDDSIAGFSFDAVAGKLRPIPESHRGLSGEGTGAAQISFNQDGDALVITEKATNKITTFTLNDDGTPAASHSIDSAGTTPFGFSFGKRDQFFVSNAEGGLPGQGTVSAYELKEDGGVETLDAGVLSGQTAACWLITTPNGRLAFTADTPANAISSFAVDHDGHLTLRQSKAAAENRPGDLAVSPDGQMLYSLNRDGSIGVYHILKNGELEKLESVAGLPAASTGLVVR